MPDALHVLQGVSALSPSAAHVSVQVKNNGTAPTPPQPPATSAPPATSKTQGAANAIKDALTDPLRVPAEIIGALSG